MMATTPKIRPSAAYYALAAPFFVVGMAFCFYTLIHGLLHVTDRLTQVVVPGNRDFVFKRNIGYTVFLEEVSVVEGKPYLTRGSLVGLTCKVESLSNGRVIEPGPARGSATYNFPGRSGRAIWGFSVPEDGSYRFGCSYPAEQPGSKTVVAVGQGFGWEIVRIVLTCIVWAFAGIGCATAVCLIVFIARERSKRQLREAMPSGA